MSKRYKIEKLTDILAIPEDKLDDFFADLKTYHGVCNNLIALGHTIGEIKGIDGTVIPKNFVWIDDGKHDAKVHFVTKPSVSGSSKGKHGA